MLTHAKSRARGSASYSSTSAPPYGAHDTPTFGAVTARGQGSGDLVGGATGVSRLGLATVQPGGNWMYVSRGARRATRARVSAAVLGAALLLAACSSSGDGNKEGEGAKDGAAITQQPKEADPFWVNPDGNAAKQVAAYAKSGKDDEAEQIRKIAQQPTGEWIGPENPEQGGPGFTGGAEKGGRTAP